MKLKITDAADKWFHDEMGLSDGMGVQLYGKVYGFTNVHYGFSPAFAREDTPVDPVLEVKKNGINYHIDEMDEWFFTDLDTVVDYDGKTDGPKFSFVREDPDVLDVNVSQDGNTGASQGMPIDSNSWDEQHDGSTGPSQH